jgi:hypothetical protein
MKNNNLLKFFDEYFKQYYCTFNSKGELILVGLYRESIILIHIYSVQTNNNELKLKRIYSIPEDFELTELITSYDKLYLFSDDYIYELNSHTEKYRMFEMNTKVRLRKYAIFNSNMYYNEIIVI